MYLGHIVETADCDELFDNPFASYTQALLAAVPVARSPCRGDAHVPPGQGRSAESDQSAIRCVFHHAVPMAVDRCKRERPALREAAAGHWVLVAGHYAVPIAWNIFSSLSAAAGERVGPVASTWEGEKTQPDGGLIGLGTSPLAGRNVRVASTRGSGTGTAASNACV